MTDQLITQAQLDSLERAADKVFGKLGIDIEFTRHFLDRVNDERNNKQITIGELGRILAKEYQRWGRTISKMPINSQAVMKDLSTELNIPFVINKDGNGKDLIAKTVMRKKNFSTPDRQLPVESVTEDSSEDEATGLVTSAIAYLRKRSDKLDTVAIMKKGNTYASNDTQAPGFQQKLNSGWKVVAYVERRGTSIRTDSAHKFLKTVMSKDVTEDAATPSTYANIEYDYSENWASIKLVKDGQVVEKWNDYFSSNATGNPLVDKFIELAKQNGMNPEGMTITDESGKTGVFTGNKFTWGNVAEEVGDKRDRDTEQSDVEYIAQRRAKSNWKKKHPDKAWPGYARAKEQLEELDTPPLDVKTLTPEVIADKHEVNLSMIENELKKGVKAEMEHTSDKATAMEIALDHLAEMPNYYSKVPRMNEMLTKGAWEVTQLRERVMDPREQILRKALQYLDSMIKSNGDTQSIGGYAFDIARAFNLKDIITARELAQLYNDWQTE
jgi:hypothetical protein